MTQREIIEDLLRKNSRVTLRMLFDAGTGYTGRNRISEMKKDGWQIDHYSHDQAKGEVVSDNAYVLISEPAVFDKVGQGQMDLK